MNTRSLYFRLIAWYGGLVIAVALAFGLLTYRSLHSRLIDEMANLLTHRAQLLGQNIAPGASRQALASQIQTVYSPEASNRFIRVLGPDGAPLYVSGEPKDGLFSPKDVPLPASLKAGQSVRFEPLPYGFDMLITSVPHPMGNDTWTVEMGAPTDQVNAALRELLTTLLFTLPLLVLVAAAGGYYLVRGSLQPVEAIRATAEKITFGNLSNRLPIAHTGDELEHLSVTLNHMLKRLEDAYLQTSRFSADASHELRTPLTIMRAELESILQEPELPPSLREQVGSVLEEAEHLSRITESLFAISRLEAGEAKMNAAVLDLAELARNTAEQMHLLAEDRQIALPIEAASEVLVEGDPVRLKQVMVNVFDNAIKYTPRGGRVAIGVTAAGGRAVLEIRDNGQGIPQDALPHVFERFYRADKMRARESTGAGLGLSIARSIVLAHGGRIGIQSREGAGTTVTVELPLYAPRQEKP